MARERGNDSFKNGAFLVAIEEYRMALDECKCKVDYDRAYSCSLRDLFIACCTRVLDSTFSTCVHCSACHGNIAMCLKKLNRSNEDEFFRRLLLSLFCSRRWEKAVYRVCSSEELGRRIGGESGLVGYLLSLNLNNNDDLLQRLLCKKISSASKNGGAAEVEFVSRKRGKGVVFLGSTSVSPGSPVFTERRPLFLARKFCSLTYPDVIDQCCDKCLRSTLRVSRLPPSLRPLASRPPLAPKFVSFKTSEEDEAMIFCSNECKDAAFEEFWRPLPLRYVELARELGKTSALIVGQMMLSVASKCSLNGGESESDLTDSTLPLFSPRWHRLAVFCHAIDDIQDERTLIAPLVNALSDYIRARPNIFHSGWTSLVNEEVFLRLTSVLMMNAQDLQPISLVQDRLRGMEEREQMKLMKQAYPNCAESSEWQAKLAEEQCVQATALFAVANMLNHSCSPNVVSACTSTDARIHLIALREITPNEELVMSYIDEEAPVAQRRARLAQFYHFKCDCSKCKTE